MRTTSISLLAVVVLVASRGSSDCWGGSVRHDRPAAKYRELGQASAFRSVGEVTRPPAPGSNWSAGGSAVLIAPQWVLTAGHVAAYTYWEKHRYRFGGEQYRVVRRVVYPAPSVKPAGLDARLACMAAGADLALVKLDRPVQNVRPAVRYRGNDEVGRTMTKVGYGCIGDGLAGMTVPPTQERRGGNNVIDAAGGKLGELTVSERVLLCDFDHPDDRTLSRLGAPTPLELEMGPAVGDSGGDGPFETVVPGSLWPSNPGISHRREIPMTGALQSTTGPLSRGCAFPPPTTGSTP